MGLPSHSVSIFFKPLPDIAHLFLIKRFVLYIYWKGIISRLSARAIWINQVSIWYSFGGWRIEQISRESDMNCFSSGRFLTIYMTMSHQFPKLCCRHWRCPSRWTSRVQGEVFPRFSSALLLPVFVFKGLGLRGKQRVQTATQYVMIILRSRNLSPEPIRTEATLAKLSKGYIQHSRDIRRASLHPSLRPPDAASCHSDTWKNLWDILWCISAKSIPHYQLRCLLLS